MDPGITLRARGLARVVAPASSVAQVEVKLSNGSHAEEPEPGSGYDGPTEHSHSLSGSDGGGSDWQWLTEGCHTATYE